MNREALAGIEPASIFGRLPKITYSVRRKRRFCGGLFSPRVVSQRRIYNDRQGL